MPELAPAVIAALIGAAATATTTGLQLSGAFTPPRDLKQQEELQKEQALSAQKQQEQAQKQAFLHASPDAQEATSGFLSPAAFSSFVNQLTGNQGTIGSAANTLGLNISGGTEGTPANSQGKGFTDALAKLFPQGTEGQGLDNSTLTSPQG